MQLQELAPEFAEEKLSGRLRRMVPVVGVIALGLVCARPGFIRMQEWWETSSAQNYHYQYGYSTEALVWFAVAVMAVGLTLSGHRRSVTRLMWAGIALAGFAVLIQPLAFDRNAPVLQGRRSMSEQLSALQADIARLTTEFKHLPFAKAETGRLSITGEPTPIIRSGMAHTFRFIVAGQRDEIFKSPPVGAEPGDIYYTISSDEKSYTLSIVGIGGNVSDRMIIDPQLSKSGLTP